MYHLSFIIPGSVLLKIWYENVCRDEVIFALGCKLTLAGSKCLCLWHDFLTDAFVMLYFILPSTEMRLKFHQWLHVSAVVH